MWWNSGWYVAMYYRKRNASSNEHVPHKCISTVPNSKTTRKNNLHGWINNCSQGYSSRLLTWCFQSVITSSNRSKSYELLASTSTMSWRWSNTSIVLLAVASFRRGDCVKSVALLVKKLYSQAFPSQLSNHCSVYRTLLLVSSLTLSQGTTSLLFWCAYTGCG